MKKYIFILVLPCVAILTYAQSDISNLIAHRAQQKVKQMTDYVAYMADKEKPIEDRKEYRIAALNLFISHGEPYIVNGASRKGVYMQITSKYRKKPNQRLLKDYFTGLINMRYSKVVIQSSDIACIKVSELKKIADHEYECTCSYIQSFYGKSDGNLINKAEKIQITCRIIENQDIKVSLVNDEKITPEKYIILLGDVRAEDYTNKIRN